MNEDNKTLISHLKEKGLLREKELEKAFMKVDRADFVEADYKVEAYEDYPLPIGFGQTISQPTTVAFMLELLDLKKGDNVLDVGSGSGWTTALIAEMVKEKGRVCGVEIIPELVELGRKNLGKYDLSNSKIAQSGKELGFAENAPYDKILVSAEAESIPKELANQLKEGGIMVMPINNALHKLEKIAGGKIKETSFPGFVFVPLIS